jgi:hypothetical protein
MFRVNNRRKRCPSAGAHEEAENGLTGKVPMNEDPRRRVGGIEDSVAVDSVP